MADKELTTQKRLEHGRVEFAYKCAEQNITLKNFSHKNVEIKTSLIIRTAFQKKFEKNITNNEQNKNVLETFLSEAQLTYPQYDKKNKDSIEKKVADYYEKYGKEYKSYVKKIPMLIKTNGIGVTFAYVNSKAKDGNAYELIYQQTTEWLKREPRGLVTDKNKDLIEVIVSRDSTVYRAMTNEALAFFTWLKRFADGLIKGEAENE